MNTKINHILKQEIKRQKETISLIPSENYASRAVRKLVGSVFMNKYAEGYPKKRYYQGNENVDKIEEYAVDLAKKLFAVPHANVQPYSGSPANSAALFALCEPGDTIIGLNLSSGGHLTHGHPKITFSGKYFNSIQFQTYKHTTKNGIDIVSNDITAPKNIDRYDLIQYEELKELVLKHKPRVIIIGQTSYPFIFNWQKLGEIADLTGSYLIADISHVAGLVVGKVYPSPVNFAHVITTTTHKTLRGPRGAIIMVTSNGLKKDPDLGNKIDKAVFPGFQGGPHNNTTAAIAQALSEASGEEFVKYAKQIVANSKILAKTLLSRGLDLVGEGTTTHLCVINLTKQNLNGNIVAIALEKAGIVVNKNSIPGDISPYYPSGVRIGTPACTTRGMKENEMIIIGNMIADVVLHLKDIVIPQDKKEKAIFIKNFENMANKDKYLLNIKKEVHKLALKYKVPK